MEERRLREGEAVQVAHQQEHPEAAIEHEAAAELELDACLDGEMP
jgi:hypothetical protein